MASFDKSAVDVAELSASELARVVEALLEEKPARTWKLSNGSCAANYGVSYRDRDAVVKAVVGEDCAVLAANQARVLRALAGSGVAPEALGAARTVLCETTTGASACAMAMALVPGQAANVLVRRQGVPAVAAYGALGTSLGRLHSLATEDVVVVENDLADPRYLEKFVRVPGALEDAISADWLSAARLERARAVLRRSDLPRGILHGDPYADNLVVRYEDGVVTNATFVDWEDVALGPLAYDLACALVACAFDGRTLDEPVATAVLRNYAAQRPAFSDLEAAALVDLMLANALACASYRWHQFHVVDPDASPAAKASHLEMLAIAAALEDSAGDTVLRIARSSSSSCPPSS
mmetsp:Transcript_20000/g.61885  ORF Transcript_20000/g.61885 Transcript_20000/m.61885 type:complete len:352 (-) Transcript_20000:48-1103(-)|eukprot:CAMPEP_0198643794 /NCGR_PEP_ID=MMETSP1467-20131203/96_1 /TAXON_ID=1462469 /ORGANISM="unid. sp., Strain CCMP2135" /LENGTH=351 /DNA_ID=CAMNT_0044379211 /DNA_START=213 /DNA_END=1268 /DNA_ORIENTATION=-